MRWMRLAACAVVSVVAFVLGQAAPALAATWSIQSAPIPAGATSSAFSGVSCTTLTTCVAVGDYVNGSGVELTLASPKGGQPPVDPKSDLSENQTPAMARFK